MTEIQSGSDVTSQVFTSHRTLANSHTHVFSCVVHFPLTSPTREEKEGGRFEREERDRQKERGKRKTKQGKSAKEMEERQSVLK